MIEQAYLDQSKGVAQACRDDLVGLTGLSNSTGMVVGEYHGAGIAGQCLLDHFPGVHARPVDGAPEQLLAAREPVPAVEKEAAEHLVLEVPEARDQVVAGGARAREHGTGLEPLEVMAAHDFERGLQLRPARGSDARLVAERGASRGQQPAQRAEATEQRTGEVERVHAARAVPQPDREEFSLGQRPGAAGEESFARPLGRRPVADVHAWSLAHATAPGLSQIVQVPG